MPDVPESVAAKRRGKDSCASPPLARLQSSVWKENLNPVLFVSSSLESALVSMETGFGPLGGKLHPAVTDCSDFPLPGPSLKPSDASTPCPREGLPRALLRSLSQRLEAQGPLSVPLSSGHGTECLLCGQP